MSEVSKMSILELNSVAKDYPIGETVVHAVRGVTLEIKPGEFIVILGKSGSGKSTLLSLMGGLEQPTKGRINLNGINLGNLTEDELALMRRNDIGIIFQHFFLLVCH